MRPDPDLVRLVTAAHDATERLEPGVDAIALYRAAAIVAERQVPAPLGIAVAGVLARAAEDRRVSCLRGHLGENHTMLALALAALALGQS